jgi:hypothetical protein
MSVTQDMSVIFSLGTPVSSTIKTYLHDITEILNIVESGAKHHKPNHRQCWLCDDFG